MVLVKQDEKKKIIKRALKIVDKLIIAVAQDSSKNPIFSLSKRVEMVSNEIKDFNKNEKKIEVYSFEGLLVNFAKLNNAFNDFLSLK